MYTCLMTKIKYLKCEREDSQHEEPIKVLARLQRLRKMGATMHHNHGANYISDDQFTFMFWHIFPMDMQEWLEEDQNLDPFDPANSMYHEDIAGHMQQYWSLHFKRSNRENGSSKNKHRWDDVDDSTNDEEDDQGVGTENDSIDNDGNDSAGPRKKWQQPHQQQQAAITAPSRGMRAINMIGLAASSILRTSSAGLMPTQPRSFMRTKHTD